MAVTAAIQCNTFFHFNTSSSVRQVESKVICRGEASCQPKTPQHGSFRESRASMKLKTVYLNGDAVGSARTWHEVATLLTKLLRSHVSARDAQTRGSEGPNGFFIALPG